MDTKKRTAPKNAKKTEEYVIVRCSQAGVHAGYLVSADAKKNEIVLRDARRIWYWSGAASLSEIAVYGLNPAKSATSKICAKVATQRLRFDDHCEVIVCQDAGKNSIEGMSEWRA